MHQPQVGLLVAALVTTPLAAATTTVSAAAPPRLAELDTRIPWSGRYKSEPRCVYRMGRCLVNALRNLAASRAFRREGVWKASFRVRALTVCRRWSMAVVVHRVVWAGSQVATDNEGAKHASGWSWVSSTSRGGPLWERGELPRRLFTSRRGRLPGLRRGSGAGRWRWCPRIPWGWRPRQPSRPGRACAVRGSLVRRSTHWRRRQR